MNIAVSSIVEVSMNKIALQIRVGVDDWTAERAIIASNESQKSALKFTNLAQRRMSSKSTETKNRLRNVYWNMLMWTHLRPAEILKAGVPW